MDFRKISLIILIFLRLNSNILYTRARFAGPK
jgi:hypothetical protein